MERRRTEALVALLQLSDTAFPSGAFAQSFGLEQLVRERMVRTADDLVAFVASTLAQSTAQGAAVACRRACEAVASGDIDSIVVADLALYRSMSAVELRTASLITGRRFVQETAVHLREPVLDAYARRLDDDGRLGMQPLAFGVVATSLGVAPDDVISAFLYGAANALLQASLRLMRLSHRDVQAALHRLRPEIASQTACVDAGAPLRSFHPLQEIASMRHERATARLFAS